MSSSHLRSYFLHTLRIKSFFSRTEKSYFFFLHCCSYFLPVPYRIQIVRNYKFRSFDLCCWEDCRFCACNLQMISFVSSVQSNAFVSTNTERSSFITQFNNFEAKLSIRTWIWSLCNRLEYFLRISWPTQLTFCNHDTHFSMYSIGLKQRRRLSVVLFSGINWKGHR